MDDPLLAGARALRPAHRQHPRRAAGRAGAAISPRAVAPGGQPAARRPADDAGARRCAPPTAARASASPRGWSTATGRSCGCGGEARAEDRRPRGGVARRSRSALFMLAGWIGSVDPAQRRTGASPRDGIEIMVETNGVHTALVMPLVTPQKDWRARLSRRRPAAPDRGPTPTSRSAGASARCSSTRPTWGDLSPPTALRRRDRRRRAAPRRALRPPRPGRRLPARCACGPRNTRRLVARDRGAGLAAAASARAIPATSA